MIPREKLHASPRLRPRPPVRPAPPRTRIITRSALALVDFVSVAALAVVGVVLAIQRNEPPVRITVQPMIAELPLDNMGPALPDPMDDDNPGREAIDALARRELWEEDVINARAYGIRPETISWAPIYPLPARPSRRFLELPHWSTLASGVRFGEPPPPPGPAMPRSPLPTILFLAP
jgi:hypothetical protein